MAIENSKAIVKFSAGISERRLMRALSENKGRYVVNKDGYISLNFNSIDAWKEIERHIINLATIQHSK